MRNNLLNLSTVKIVCLELLCIQFGVGMDQLGSAKKSCNGVVAKNISGYLLRPRETNYPSLTWNNQPAGNKLFPPQHNT